MAFVWVQTVCTAARRYIVLYLHFYDVGLLQLASIVLLSMQKKDKAVVFTVQRKNKAVVFTVQRKNKALVLTVQNKQKNSIMKF